MESRRGRAGEGLPALKLPEGGAAGTSPGRGGDGIQAVTAGARAHPCPVSAGGARGGRWGARLAFALLGKQAAAPASTSGKFG